LSVASVRPFFFPRYGHHCSLHSFPTRRSSDLAGVYAANQLFATLDTTLRRLPITSDLTAILADTVGFIRQLPHELVAAFRSTLRSEEHTSELQSRENLVCRLLLEKKKKKAWST